jgi:hypothetical protein
MSDTDVRPRVLKQQAKAHAEQARERAERRRGETSGGLRASVAERAARWDLGGPDELVMQRQKYLWNVLVDYWFRMEMDGWENLPEPPCC